MRGWSQAGEHCGVPQTAATGDGTMKGDKSGTVEDWRRFHGGPPPHDFHDPYWRRVEPRVIPFFECFTVKTCRLAQLFVQEVDGVERQFPVDNADGINEHHKKDMIFRNCYRQADLLAKHIVYMIMERFPANEVELLMMLIEHNMVGQEKPGPGLEELL